MDIMRKGFTLLRLTLFSCDHHATVPEIHDTPVSPVHHDLDRHVLWPDLPQLRPISARRAQNRLLILTHAEP